MAAGPGACVDTEELKKSEEEDTKNQPENESLKNEVEKLKEFNAKQQSQIEALIKANEELQKRNAQLLDEKKEMAKTKDNENENDKNMYPDRTHLKAEPSSASIIGISDTAINDLDEPESKEKEKESIQLLSMESRLNRAKISLEQYLKPVDTDFGLKINTEVTQDIVKKIQSIPKWVLDGAQGIAFLSVIKVGFVIAANIGAGFIIIKRDDGKWSSPAAIGVAGISAGFLAGASKVDYIMILQDDIAIKQFTSQGHIRLGAEVQLTVGPVWY